MRHLFGFLAVLPILAACTSDPQTPESAPRTGEPAGGDAMAAEESDAAPVHHEDARTREILFRLKGPEEERPTNRR